MRRSSGVGTTDRELERMYAVAKLSPDQARRVFDATPENTARVRLHQLVEQRALMDHETVELHAHAQRLGVQVTIERVHLGSD